MAYKPPLEEGELQSLNLRAIKKWLADNKGRIKAKPNQSLLYSGRIYDLDVIPDMPKEDRDEFLASPVWMTIEKHRKLHEEKKIPFKYETLEQVLKEIRDYPEIVDKDRIPEQFKDAFDFFSSIKKHTKLLPNAKAVDAECWDSLSVLYCSNAVGNIAILDGYSDYFGMLDKQKVLLNKELEALQKNKKLSAAGKLVLLKKMTKYRKLFDQRYTEVIRHLDEATGACQGSCRLSHADFC